MKPEAQIKALAELDGWTERQCEDINVWAWFHNEEQMTAWLDKSWHAEYPPVDYLDSYDAIIPLIQKQEWDVKCEVAIQLRIAKQKTLVMVPTMDNLEGWCVVMLCATPAQLCEALLRATGKWKE